MRTIWTVGARADLQAIHAYIARDSARAAARLARQIRAAVARLHSFPEIGAVVEDWDRADVHEILISNYRIIYRLSGNEAHIITVIHAARRLPGSPDL